MWFIACSVPSQLHRQYYRIGAISTRAKVLICQENEARVGKADAGITKAISRIWLSTTINHEAIPYTHVLGDLLQVPSNWLPLLVKVAQEFV